MATVTARSGDELPAPLAFGPSVALGAKVGADDVGPTAGEEMSRSWKVEEAAETGSEGGAGAAALNGSAKGSPGAGTGSPSGSSTCATRARARGWVVMRACVPLPPAAG